MTIERREPRALQGVRSIVFSARSMQAGDDPTSEVVKEAAQWIQDHRQYAPLYVMYDQWTDDTQLQGLSASQKLLAHIFPREDGRVCLWYATATVFYEDDESREIPPPSLWEADL